MKLDGEEKEILESVERGEWRSVKGVKRDRGQLQSVCQGNVSQGPSPQHPHLEQGPGGDPEAGARGRLPYQTLISSLLHKYASGRLREG